MPKFVTCPHPDHGETFWAARRFPIEACDRHPHSNPKLAIYWTLWYKEKVIKELPSQNVFEVILKALPSMHVKPSEW